MQETGKGFTACSRESESEKNLLGELCLCFVNLGRVEILCALSPLWEGGANHSNPGKKFHVILRVTPSPQPAS